jgi:segregation and condensation protein B
VNDRGQQLRLVEALLFAAGEPLSEAALAQRLGDAADTPALLGELAGHYEDRGVNLVRLAGGWAFRTAPDLAPHLRIERPVARKLSRAAVETLAVIAYHQPVTRAEIEEIRGVALGKGTLDTLMEAGWVRPKGRRMTPGRPLLWVTTNGFLAHFGLDTLGDLPAIEELRAAGLLDLTPPVLGEEANPAANTEMLPDHTNPSFPRKREPRSSDVPLSLDPSPDLIRGSRGGDSGNGSA